MRKGFALDGNGSPVRDFVDNVAPKHIAAGVDEISDRIGILLKERPHPAVVIDGNATERARIGHVSEVQCDRRIAFAMQCNLRSNVVAGKHIAVEDNDGRIGSTAQPRSDIANTTTGAHRLGLGDVFEVETERRTVTEMRLEGLRPIRRGEHHMIDTGRLRPGQLMGKERHTSSRQHGLSDAQRQRP